MRCHSESRAIPKKVSDRRKYMIVMLFRRSTVVGLRWDNMCERELHETERTARPAAGLIGTRAYSFWAVRIVRPSSFQVIM
jgi:hypothetical protein